MLVVYPQTKIYFSKWEDISFCSSQVKNHGKIVMGGLSTAVANINDLTNGLAKLSEIHAFDLKVDPANFKVNYWFQSYRPSLTFMQGQGVIPISKQNKTKQNKKCFPQLLGHCIHVVVAKMFPKDFTPEVHLAFDKFLAAVALALAEKYR